MSYVSHIRSQSPQKTRSASRRLFDPGGWGDRVVFGYMYRTLNALVALAFPTAIVVLWGASNGWQPASNMIWFIGVFAIAGITAGESLRVLVYNDRVLRFDTGVKRTVRVEELTGRFYIASFSPTLRIIARVVDFIWPALLLFTLSPLLVAISVLIKVDSRGPVIQKIDAIGREGHGFNLYQFRVLKEEVNGRGLGTGVYSRAGLMLAKTGMYRLPELLNLLYGSVTLFGPPAIARVDFDEILERLPEGDEISVSLRQRLEVKPGLFPLYVGEVFKPVFTALISIVPAVVGIVFASTDIISFMEELVAKLWR